VSSLQVPKWLSLKHQGRELLLGEPICFFVKADFAATSPQNSHFAAKRRNCIGQNVLKSRPKERKCFGISEPFCSPMGSLPSRSQRAHNLGFYEEDSCFGTRDFHLGRWRAQGAGDIGRARLDSTSRSHSHIHRTKRLDARRIPRLYCCPNTGGKTQPLCRSLRGIFVL